MKSIRNWFVLAAIAGVLGATQVLAQPGPPGGGGGPGGMRMGQGGMGTNWMAHRQEMMQEHQKVMQELKTMDADIDKKVAQMNQAKGSAKTDAMAGVVNDLVKENKLMHQHMSEMHQRMMSHMQSRSSGMGGAEPAGGGSTSGSGSQPSKE